MFWGIAVVVALAAFISYKVMKRRQLNVKVEAIIRENENTETKYKELMKSLFSNITPDGKLTVSLGNFLAASLVKRVDEDGHQQRLSHFINEGKVKIKDAPIYISEVKKDYKDSMRYCWAAKGGVYLGSICPEFGGLIKSEYAYKKNVQGDHYSKSLDENLIVKLRTDIYEEETAVPEVLLTGERNIDFIIDGIEQFDETYDLSGGSDRIDDYTKVRLVIKGIVMRQTIKSGFVQN